MDQVTKYLYDDGDGGPKMWTVDMSSISNIIDVQPVTHVDNVTADIDGEDDDQEEEDDVARELPAHCHVRVHVQN